VQLADGIWAWQPMVSSVSPDWVPYRDRGHWVLTDEGWYWSSDYSWGWAAFHYGRWSRERSFGWVWHPGSVWAPAWVTWRNSETYAGWAPLPPGVLLQPDVGLIAGPGLAGFDDSFGISATWFTFVNFNNFQSRSLAAVAAPAPRAAALFKSATPVNNYSVSGRKVLNLGVAPDLIAAATKAPVRKYPLQETSSPDTVGARPRSQTLSVFRPSISPATAPLQAAPINKRAKAADADPSFDRAFAPKTAAATEDDSGATGRPASAEAPARTGLTAGNFRPSSRPFQPAQAGPPGVAYSPPGGDFRRNPPPAESVAGYPAPGPSPYSSRAYYASPSAAPAYSAPTRTAPAYVPQQAAPSESRGSGSVIVSGGASSTSSASKSGAKN
jgi:hypothetical protein